MEGGGGAGGGRGNWGIWEAEVWTVPLIVEIITFVYYVTSFVRVNVVIEFGAFITTIVQNIAPE